MSARQEWRWWFAVKLLSRAYYLLEPEMTRRSLYAYRRLARTLKNHRRFDVVPMRDKRRIDHAL